MLLTILVVLFITIFVYLWYLENNHHRKYGHIPGPKGLPIVGNFFDLNQKDDHGRVMTMQVILNKWRHQFGPIFKFRIGPLTYVVFSTYDTIMEAMVTKGKDFAGKPYQYRLELTGDTHSLGGMSYTPLCKVLRKICLRKINVYAEGGTKVEATVTETFHQRFEKLQDMDGTQIAAKDMAMDESTDILYTLLFGKPASLKDMTVKTMKDLNVTFNMALASSFQALVLDLFPALHIFPNKVYDACVRFRKINDEFWNKEINEHKKTRDESVEECFMDTLLKEHETRTANRDDVIISRDNIIAMSSIMYIAGLTTMTSALTSLMLCMVKNPSLQERMYDEIISVVGKSGKISIKRRNELPYIRAVIFETLRYATPVPIPIPRCTMCDTSVAGYSIPEGTPVMVNVHGVHHDPDYWPDPYTFRPERFLDPDGQLVTPEHPHRRRILSFGAGERACVGEQVAINKMFLFMALLVQRFQLVAAPGQVLPPSDPREFTPGLVEAPNSYNILLKPR